MMIKFYIYVFLRNPNDMSDIAMIGLILNVIAVVGYIEGLQ